MNEIEIFLKYLNQYLSGGCSIEEVRIHFENLDNFHDFWHYISDENIRAKDTDYADMQNKELALFIKAMENKTMQKLIALHSLAVVAYNKSFVWDAPLRCAAPQLKR